MSYVYFKVCKKYEIYILKKKDYNVFLMYSNIMPMVPNKGFILFYVSWILAIKGTLICTLDYQKNFNKLRY